MDIIKTFINPTWQNILFWLILLFLVPLLGNKKANALVINFLDILSNLLGHMLKILIVVGLLALALLCYMYLYGGIKP